MQFSEETSQRLTEYLKQKEARDVCIKLKIFQDTDSLDVAVEKTKEYINTNLRGKYIGEIASNNFFKQLQFYIENSDFGRIPEKNNTINYNLLLPICNQGNGYRNGFRFEGDYLGQDGKEYIVKLAEGVKGNVAGRKYEQDATLNPTLAYAFFKYIGQPCARNLVAYEKFPYYHILSENFLENNQKIFGLDNADFMEEKLLVDENNNITHKQIMDAIEGTISKKDFPPDKAKSISKKLKLQYAVQETLKGLIYSMDENISNTSFVVTEDENGKIEDINISPAYDLDLSFNLGEEMLQNMGSQEVLYRTTQDGKMDLGNLINEFSEIEGYKQELERVKEKLNANYVNEIFDIAYKTSGISKFNNNEIKDRIGNFIMRRIATFKEAYKSTFEKEDKIKIQ